MAQKAPPSPTRHTSRLTCASWPGTQFHRRVFALDPAWPRFYPSRRSGTLGSGTPVPPDHRHANAAGAPNSGQRERGGSRASPSRSCALGMLRRSTGKRFSGHLNEDGGGPTAPGDLHAASTFDTPDHYARSLDRASTQELLPPSRGDGPPEDLAAG